jgi:hypothetical protein
LFIPVTIVERTVSVRGGRGKSRQAMRFLAGGVRV